jgi:hypothetical protein
MLLMEKLARRIKERWNKYGGTIILGTADIRDLYMEIEPVNSRPTDEAHLVLVATPFGEFRIVRDDSVTPGHFIFGGNPEEIPIYDTRDVGDKGRQED